jgi:HK97 family phage portal protein
MGSLATRFKAALSGLFLGRQAGRPLVYAIPVRTFSPRRGTREVLAAYRENAWLRAVVHTVAGAVATPSWRVFLPVTTQGKRLLRSCKAVGADRRAGLEGVLERHKSLAGGVARGDVVEVHQHELLSILQHPHPKHTGRAYRELMQVHLDLAGEAFLWLRRAEDDGRVVGFEVIPPQCVVMTPTASPEGTYHIIYNNFAGQVAESEIIWLKHLDPENPEGRGAGMGLALGDELDTAEAIQGARKATFQRGGMPAATVGVDPAEGDDGADAVEALKKEYQDSFKGPQDAGKLWFVPGKVTVAQLDQDFRALQLDESERGIKDYVRQCFNIPPELMGDLVSGTRATAEEAKYTLAEYAVLPRMEFLREGYQLYLVPLVDEDALLEYQDPRPQSWERQLKAMTSAFGAHVYMNEARLLAGLPPDPKLKGVRFMPLPGAQPVQDEDKKPTNPPPPRGPGKE